MSHYKLTYLRNVNARAETPRMLFELAGQEYEFCPVTREEWTKVKHERSPFGQLPTLDVDGVQLCQSKCIERFLARRFGLYGSNEMEQAKSDMVADCLEDIRLPMRDIKWATEEQVPALRQKYEEGKLPVYLSSLEKMVSSNGYVNGNGLTWPDLVMYNIIHYGKETALLKIDPLLKSCPNITRLFSNVETNPKISAYLKKRPQITQK